jgi:RNA chaperone Hfq
METNLLDRMLNGYQTAQTPVTVTLQNKIRITGKIRAFDGYVIVMDGQKREIIYRHAVSSLAPQTAQEEQKRQPAPSSRSSSVKPAPRPQKAAQHRSRPGAQHISLSAAAGSESSINSGMKEGLLKWMQEQKAK